MIDDLELETRLSSLESELAAFVAGRSPENIAQSLSHGCFVYGAGGFGRRMATLLREKGFPCLGFLDRQAGPEAGERDGLPFRHPDSLTAAQAEGHCFVLGVHNYQADVAEILAFARRLPFRDVVWNADLPDVLGPAADNFWLTRRRFLLENFDQIRQAAGLFADPLSVETLCQLVRFRVTGNYADHPAVVGMATQYLPAELPGFDAPITLVDGGSYTGDTYRSLVSGGVRIDRWIAFEPDTANFQLLAQHARAATAQTILYPCGLSDHLHQVHFQADLGTGSRIIEGQAANTTTILCVALDEVLHGIVPDYIKLDIEGAEDAALRGMERTIRLARPRMAVSAYHLPQDLWAIPQRLTSLLPGEPLYLRQHCQSAFETVVYAIPR